MIHVLFHKLFCWRKVECVRRLEYPDVFTDIYRCRCGWKIECPGSN